MIKRIAITFGLLALTLIFFFAWFISLLGDEVTSSLRQVEAHELAYLANPVALKRGRILAVVTSTELMGPENKKTGFELTELARAFHVFRVNGFQVDVASPLGGEPPMVLDEDDMGPYDYAFLNDASNMSMLKNTLRLDQVNPTQYDAVYFVGGKGTMFDFPDNYHIQQLVKHFWAQDKVIAAICHGPAAFVNVMLDNGNWFIDNKKVAGFSNDEELFLIPDAQKIFPFLLQTRLERRGANYSEGGRYLNHVVVDGNLITGQNPWSVWHLAEQTITQLGYQPVLRPITAEEHSISILEAYSVQGFEKASRQLHQVLNTVGNDISRNMLAVHAFVALIEWDVRKTIDLLRLLNSAKKNKGDS